MKAGKLRHKLIVQQQTDRQAPNGEVIEEYEKVFNAKGDFRFVTGSAILKNGMAMTSEYATISMRYDERLSYEHFILFKGNRYSVSMITPNVRYTEMIVTVMRDVS